MRLRECSWLPPLILCLLILLYLVNFSALSILKHDAFMTHTRDLGNMDQPIWNTLHGRLLEETRADGRQATRLTDHFEPIFIPVSLVFLLWDDVRALLILQTLFLALGAVPVFWIARERFKAKENPLAGCWMGVLFAGVYLLFPALQAANLTEFHAAPLAVPLLLCAYYFGRRGDVIPFWAFSLLSLTVKEEVSLLTFMLGLYLLWKGEKRWMGLALAAVSLAWFAVSTFAIIPAAGREFYAGLEDSIYFARYGEFGNGPKDIVMNLLRQPVQIIRALTTEERLLYVFGLLASVGFLAIFDLATTLIGLPILMANLLSNYPPMYSGEMHYSALLVPFTMAGAIGGAGWLVDRIARRGWTSRRNARVIIALWLALCSLGYHAIRGYTPLSVRYEAPAVTEHHRLLRRFAAQIPIDAPLSTTAPLFPHFAHRERIHQFPVIVDAEYVLLDAASTTDMHPNDFHQSYLDLFASDFKIVDASDGYVLLHKSLEGAESLPDEFYDFVRVDAVDPAYTYDIVFGDTVRFLGFTLVDDPMWRMTRVRTNWQVLAEPADTLRLYLFFMTREGDVVEDTNQRPMVGTIWYPPSMWQAGDLLQLDTLPRDLGEEFNFCVGVTQSDNWQDIGSRLRVSVAEDENENPAHVMEDGTWVRLHTFVRKRRFSGSRLAPVLMADEVRVPRKNRVNIIFANADDVIELLGFDLENSPAFPGDEPALTLYWRAERPLNRDYTVFVHVRSEANGSVPQMDSAPNWRGPLPTTSWHPDEVVPDTHRLNLPADTATGTYELSVGLYYWESMERLQATGTAGEDLGDAVTLTTLEVRAAQ